MRQDKLDNIATVLNKFDRRESTTSEVLNRIDISKRTVYTIKDLLLDSGILIETNVMKKIKINGKELSKRAMNLYERKGEYYVGVVPAKGEKIPKELTEEVRKFIENPSDSSFKKLKMEARRLDVKG